MEEKRINYILTTLFWIFTFLIIFTVVGYPFSLIILNKWVKKDYVTKDLQSRPYVSIIIAAHNEEEVIQQKLNNLIELDYPLDKFEIIITSDNSTDQTNYIVDRFIQEKRQVNIQLYKVKKRQGKTNAQNEAVNIAKGEVLIFSDANSILKKDAIIQLVSMFTDEKVIYVTGKLQYVNSLETVVSGAENNYWNYDLFMRKVESEIKSITSGNGALYAIRKSDYVHLDPIRSHDAAMPDYAALNHKKALFNQYAIAYEKAGETSTDEFNRKVRMFRSGLSIVLKDFRKYNPFSYGWYSYFYFGHRACRRLLFLFHIFLFIVNLLLLKEHLIYTFTISFQILFYLLALLSKIFNLKNKLFNYPFYYTMTLLAQLIGTTNHLSGKSKPFWEKADTTR